MESKNEQDKFLLDFNTVLTFLHILNICKTLSKQRFPTGSQSKDFQQWF